MKDNVERGYTMIRRIAYDEIIKVKELGINIDTIAGYNNSDIVKNIIEEALNNNLSIICTGRFATGKSTLLKVILGTLNENVEKMTLDEIASESDIKLFKSGKVKYSTIHSKNIVEAYGKIVSKGTIQNTLLIELTMDIYGKRVINSISEIIKIDNCKANALIPIIMVHRENFKKINELIC